MGTLNDWQGITMASELARQAENRRIEIDGDYLIIAPNPAGDYHHSLTERAYLVDNIIAFLNNHPDVSPHQITVYELKQVNLKCQR